MYQIPSDFLGTTGLPEAGRCWIVPYTSQQTAENARVFMQTHVLSLILEGEKRVTFANQVVTASAHDVLLMKKGRCLMTEKASPRGRYASMLVFFDDAFLDAFLHDFGAENLRSTADRDFRIAPRTDAVDAWTASMQPYVEKPALLDGRLSQLKGHEALLRVATDHGAQHLAFLRSAASGAEETAFRRIVESHACDVADIASLAFLCHMSESTFRRRFREIYGVAPSQWRRERRLERAAQLLTRDGARPSEIYAEAGFSSPSSFAQAFKKRFGVSPGRYRSEC